MLWKWEQERNSFIFSFIPINCHGFKKQQLQQEEPIKAAASSGDHHRGLVSVARRGAEEKEQDGYLFKIVWCHDERKEESNNQDLIFKIHQLSNSNDGHNDSYNDDNIVHTCPIRDIDRSFTTYHD